MIEDYLTRKEFKAGHWIEVYTKSPVLNAVARLLLDYKNAHFDKADPMDAFTLEW